MTQKERLVELLDGLELPPIDTDGEMYLEKSDAEYIADYLLKNGVIVPPCKVGDVVYRLNVDCTQPCDFDCDDDCYHCKYRVANIYDVLLDGLRKVLTAMEWWGKYYFPTREAAKKALKERGE